MAVFPILPHKEQGGRTSRPRTGSSRPDLLQEFVWRRRTDADSRRELLPSTWIRKSPSVLDHLGENLGELLELARDEGAVATVCLRTV
jgi:hypothetical protein